MKIAAKSGGSSRAFYRMIALALLGLLCWAASAAASALAPQVELDASQAGPRSVESLTEKSIIRDYARAWDALAGALDHSQPEFLGGYFTGTAKEELEAAIADQTRTGVRVHYHVQRHRLKVVFYAPEGDVMELHDTFECDFQITDGGTTIHQEHAVLRYVVLMTPGADRWVVRHMQAVSRF